MLLGIGLALGAALCFGVASVWQAISVRRREAAAAAGTGAATGSASGLLRVVTDVWYVAGSALDLIGSVATAVALQKLPLFIVQSCIAASIAVTAVIAVPVLALKLNRREIVALVVVAVGLALLAVSSSPAPARALHGAAPWILLGGVAVVAAIAWFTLRHGSSAAMAATCGLAFSGTALAERTLALPHPWWHLFGQPTIYALLGYGAVGITAYASALTRGKVTTVTGVTFAVETLIPSVIGLVALDDSWRRGFAVVAIVGFVGTVAGAIALTRVAEVAEGPVTAAAAGAVEPAG